MKLATMNNNFIAMLKNHRYDESKKLTLTLGIPFKVKITMISGKINSISNSTKRKITNILTSRYLN